MPQNMKVICKICGHPMSEHYWKGKKRVCRLCGRNIGNCPSCGHPWKQHDKKGKDYVCRICHKEHQKRVRALYRKLSRRLERHEKNAPIVARSLHLLIQYQERSLKELRRRADRIEAHGETPTKYLALDGIPLPVAIRLFEKQLRRHKATEQKLPRENARISRSYARDLRRLAKIM